MKKSLFRAIASAVVASAVFVASAAAPVGMQKARGESKLRTPVAAKVERNEKEAMAIPSLSKKIKPQQRGFRSAAAHSLKKSPRRYAARAAVGYPDIYGSVVYSTAWDNDSYDFGYYYVPTAAGQSFQKEFGHTGANAGCLKDGIYYLTYDIFFMEYYFGTIFEGYDVATGEKVYEAQPVTTQYSYMSTEFALDPTTNEVYAITYSADGNGAEIGKFDFTGTDGIERTTVGGVESSIACMAFDKDGQLYAIFKSSPSAVLCKLDKTTAAVTETVGYTGHFPHYMGSCDIDAQSNRMFWSVAPQDETGYLAEVDLATGAATTVYNFQNNEEVVGLVVPKPKAEAKAPGAVTNLDAKYENGEVAVILSFDAPATLFDGTAASGSLKYYIEIDGEEYDYGTTSYGGHVTAYVFGHHGLNTFSVYCQNDAGKGPEKKIKATLGFGVPEAPQPVLTKEGSGLKLAWEPVIASVDGCYLNPQNVYYTVKDVMSDALVLSTTKETSCVIPSPSEGLHQYEVTASADGMRSAPGLSNVILIGAMVPPYSQTFDGAASFDLFTVLDANADNISWKYDDEVKAAKIGYNQNANMDDWLFTPALKLEAGNFYDISAFMASQNGRYPERFEIAIGKSPTAEGMTETLVEPTDLATTYETGETYTARFLVTTSGEYYVGIHGISDKDMYYMFADNIYVSAPISASSPAAVSDLSVVPDPNGGTSVAVNFTAPSKSGNGTKLQSLTKVELMRDDQVLKSFESPAPGSALSYNDQVPAEGDYKYSVVAYNESGKGIEASAQVHVGFVEPADLVAPAMVETSTLGEVAISWNAVTTDINGKPYPANSVTYAIYQMSGYYRYLVKDGITSTSYTFQAVPAGEQDCVQYAVFPCYGELEGAGDYTPMIFVGTPWETYQESMSDGSIEHNMMISSVGAAQWGLYNDESLEGVSAQDGDNGYLGMQGQYLNDAGALTLGKFNLAPYSAPGFTFYTYNIVGEGPDINSIVVSVREVGTETWTDVLATSPCELSDEDGWVKATANLAAYAGKVVEIRLSAEILAFAYTLFDNLRLQNLLENDLAVEIAAPATVAAGKDYTVSVTVINEAVKISGSYTVKLYDFGQVSQTKEGTALEAGAKAVFEFPCSLSALAEEEISHMAEVSYESDENPENNFSVMVNVAPKISNLPAVVDLKGKAEAEGNKLTWSEPDLSDVPETVEESFESGESFAQEFEGWTFVDRDNSLVGGFQNMEIPGIAAGETTASFFVWDQSQVGNETFEAHTGTKYLASLFRYDDGQVDDWAISPVLSGSAQTVSFFAKSYSATYPEKIEVYYSTGSVDPSDFIKIMDAKTLGDVWEEISVNLPAGAAHFAVRSLASGSFMLMLDDFTFEAGSGTADLSIVGYNVYRDEQKVTAQPVAECEYLDANVSGEHTYRVTTVYDRGESRGSNQVTVVNSGLEEFTAGIAITTVPGKVIVTGAEGLLVTVSALDGRTLYSAQAQASTTIELSPAVYLVKAGEKVAKVIVK